MKKSQVQRPIMPEHKSENDRLAKLILNFCRNMIRELDESTSEDIVNDFREFVHKNNLV